jgi:hypothetical protein
MKDRVLVATVLLLCGCSKLGGAGQSAEGAAATTGEVGVAACDAWVAQQRCLLKSAMSDAQAEESVAKVIAGYKQGMATKEGRATLANACKQAAESSASSVAAAGCASGGNPKTRAAPQGAATGDPAAPRPATSVAATAASTVAAPVKPAFVPTKPRVGTMSDGKCSIKADCDGSISTVCGDGNKCYVCPDGLGVGYGGKGHLTSYTCGPKCKGDGDKSCPEGLVCSSHVVGFKGSVCQPP